jgi:predicted nucleic acid-binding protein
MPVSVVDASAVGALLFGEPQAERVATALEGRALAAPSLLPYEVASICAKKLAAHAPEEQMLLAALALFPSLSVALHAVPPAEAVSVARRRKLTTYDASYLWLATELGADLVTLDDTLARAWKRQRG